MTDRDDLRRLTLNDESFIGTTIGIRIHDEDGDVLDRPTKALVRLAALLASGASPTSYLWAIDNAVDAGVTSHQIVGVLLAIAPVVGLARVVAAAPQLSLALGYDIDRELETLQEDDDVRS